MRVGVLRSYPTSDIDDIPGHQAAQEGVEDLKGLRSERRRAQQHKARARR